jgi:hypothetical protein
LSVVAVSQQRDGWLVLSKAFLKLDEHSNKQYILYGHYCDLTDTLKDILAMINLSNTNLDNSEIEISICHSPMSPIGGAEVGVEIKHIGTGIIVQSIELSTQHKNKLAALELLAERLLK